jgi:3-methyl-2-oxobutanoate hydroxymethyltransferase
MNVLDFQKMKDEGRKISMVTCYDYSSARAVAESTVDCILVGDSLAMTMHGHPTTLSATTAMMALHTSAVARGAPSKFIVADLPFLSYRKRLKDAMDSVQNLMTAGAHAVKLEGVRGHAEIVRHIVESGVPVMGHLGLTPQSVNLLGGMRVQARTDATVDLLASQAGELEQAGCFSLVLECVPSEVARKVTELLTIPTIGIGAIGERFIEWNFVSSSKERIAQAKADWRRGRMKLPDLDNAEFTPLPSDPLTSAGAMS